MECSISLHKLAFVRSIVTKPSLEAHQGVDIESGGEMIDSLVFLVVLEST